MSNIQRLQTALKAANIPALHVTNMVNVGWLTGFSGSSGSVVITPSDAIFMTDSRYTIQANMEVKEAEVRWFQSPKTSDMQLSEVLADLKVSQLAFEDSLTVARLSGLKKNVNTVEWLESDDLIKPLRMIKTADEIARIQEACKLADACISHVQRMLAPGVTEYEIGLDIEFFFRKHGAKIAFEPIVASGPNSAKPHARPSDRPLEKGDFVTLDLGANLDHYCSDITRTFVIGKASDRHKEVYNQVLKAETECCDLCLAGKTGVEVDQHARTVLDEKGLASYFGHGLGHGLGRDVHDFGSLSPRSTDTLAPGMVFTVEPGVYIEGFGGVRIEDDVVVTDGAPLILTQSPKDLIELG